jgi:hypothetical protein
LEIISTDWGCSTSESGDWHDGMAYTAGMVVREDEGAFGKLLVRLKSVPWQASVSE